MIATQTPEKQTGGFSRIQQPFAPISPYAIRERVLRRRIRPPVRNLLGGATPVGLWGKIRAWFRGEI